MRKARIADWILSLVMDPERSAAAVGDLVEEGSGSALRFWMSVGRTFVSAFGHAFGVGWPSIVRLTGLGLLLQLAGMIVLIAAIVAGSWALGYGLGFLPKPGGWVSLGPMIGAIYVYTLFPLIEFQVGKLLARRSPGQELAVCLALIAAQGVLGAVIDTSFSGHVDLTMFIRSLTHWSTPSFVAYIALLAGAARERRRRVAA